MHNRIIFVPRCFTENYSRGRNMATCHRRALPQVIPLQLAQVPWMWCCLVTWGALEMVVLTHKKAGIVIKKITSPETPGYPAGIISMQLKWCQVYFTNWNMHISYTFLMNWWRIFLSEKASELNGMPSLCVIFWLFSLPLPSKVTSTLACPPWEYGVWR